MSDFLVSRDGVRLGIQSSRNRAKSDQISFIYRKDPGSFSYMTNHAMVRFLHEWPVSLYPVRGWTSFAYEKTRENVQCSDC